MQGDDDRKIEQALGQIDISQVQITFFGLNFGMFGYAGIVGCFFFNGA